MCTMFMVLRDHDRICPVEMMHVYNLVIFVDSYMENILQV